MNVVRIRSVSNICLILSNYHNWDEDKQGPAYLTGVTILFGIVHPDALDPEQIKFSKQDHTTAQVVWSIIASNELESLENETAMLEKRLMW
jgi:hypothetical protein